MKQLQFTRPAIQSEMTTVEELVQVMNTLQGQQHALNQEISRLTVENQQFRQAGQGWRRLRLQLDKQFRQRFPTRTLGQINDKVWSTSKALGNLRCSRENLRNSLSELRKTTIFHDCCLWFSFPTSGRMGGRSRQRHHERCT